MTRLCQTELTPVARFGDRAIGSITEADLEALFGTLRNLAGTTFNHYFQTLKSLENRGRAKGYLARRWLSEFTELRRQPQARRHRRLVPDVCDDDGRVTTPGEERRLLDAAGPWLKNLIIAALDTGCRRGELLSLQWQDVDLTRRWITIRAEKAKTRQSRGLPISDRLAGVLELRRHDPTGPPHPGLAFVFGDVLGRPVCDPRKAWEICVLRASGFAPTWDRSTNKLSAESRARLRAIDLHFHDLRHEAGSRLIERGWPAHQVQAFLGHANLKQTSTYLNVAQGGLLDSMRRYGLGPAVPALHTLAHQASQNNGLAGNGTGAPTTHPTVN